MPVIVSKEVHFGNESLVVASDPATCPEMDSGATGVDSGREETSIISGNYAFIFIALGDTERVEA